MNTKDLKAVTIIGVAVGSLSQAIIASIIPGPSMALRVGVFFGFTALAPFALFVAHLLGKYVPVIYQFAKFAAVGALNSFVDIGILNIEFLVNPVGPSPAHPLVYPVMKAISFLGATTNSFFWNKYWTFSAKEPANAKETVKFYAVAFIGWAINVGTATFVVEGITKPAAMSQNLWGNVGALCGVAASFLWDFLGYKYLVFKKPATVPGAPVPPSPSVQ